MRPAPAASGSTSIPRSTRSFGGQGNLPATSITKEYLMAQHGYLREYDEGWNRGDDRERRDRNSDERTGDRNRGFMFEDRNGRDDSRSAFSQTGDSARERFADDDRQRRATHRDSWSSRAPNRGFGGSDRQQPPRSFSSHQDDHYRSWRDRQIQALDRDYEAYCREREQQFHSDFDDWRRNRGQGKQPTQRDSITEEVMELSNRRPDGDFDNGPSPVAEATLGTNNSENTAPGRR
jgi:hypothetical protein